MRTEMHSDRSDRLQAPRVAIILLSTNVVAPPQREPEFRNQFSFSFRLHPSNKTQFMFEFHFRAIEMSAPGRTRDACFGYI